MNQNNGYSGTLLVTGTVLMPFFSYRYLSELPLPLISHSHLLRREFTKC